MQQSSGRTNANDTIAAIATPPGRGGIGVIRISGPLVQPIAAGLCPPGLLPHRAHFRSFVDEDHTAIDAGIAVLFPAPKSYTGEDTLELHAHGGPVVLDMLLRRVLALGARLARPGEFTERAFLNDKIDLAQAEAIADLIDSTSEQAARAAQRSLQGEFSQLVHRLVEELTQLRSFVEAAIDFTDEDIDFLAEAEVRTQVEALTSQIRQLGETAHQGTLLRDGMTVVIAGRPNVGKSSLLNALSRREAAIVTDIAGTTRDVLREHILIDGMPLHIIDTAGLRTTDEVVEREGIRRARDAIAQADRVLLVLDATRPDDCADALPELPSGVRVTRIYNKVDVPGISEHFAEDTSGPKIYLSAKTGAGLDILRTHLKECMHFRHQSGSIFSARRRHLDALERAQMALDEALPHTASAALELLAEDLRAAQLALSEITGEVSSEDLLGRIFSSFCVGK